MFRILPANAFLLLLCTVLLMPAFTSAAPASRNTTPDTEQHSIIIETEGSAPLAQDKTMATIQEEALLDAKRQALKSVQVHIAARTDMKNYIVTQNVPAQAAEEAVYVLKVRDLGVEQGRYKVWIRAEIELSPAPTASKKMARGTSFMSSHAPLTVRIWTDHRQYHKGQRIVIRMQGNKDFYARIVDVNNAGDAIQLLPNDFSPSRSFKAGVVYRVPGAHDPFQLDVTPPFGRDVITVYASDAPLPELPSAPVGAGLHSLEGADLGKRMRGFAVTPVTQADTPTGAAIHDPAPQMALPAAEFYEANWSITTAP